MRVFVALLATWIMSGTASAEWVQAESDNFIFIGNVKPEHATELVEELETYRSSVLALAGAMAGPEVRKVRVFGMRRSGDVAKLTGMDVAGVYTRGDDYPVFVTVADGRFRPGDISRVVTFHEFAHHVLHSHSSQFFPRWYDEGFAEYLGSFQAQDGVVTIGLPHTQFAQALRHPAWPDAAEVLNSVTEYPFTDKRNPVERMRRAQFYAVSWLAVHYIQSTPEMRERFPRYVEQLNRGTDPTEAFEQAFGMTQKAFGERLRDYWRADQFASVQFRMTDAFPVPDVSTRRIDENTAERALLTARVRFASNDKARARTEKAFSQLEKEGAHPTLPAMKMIMALQRERYDEAVTIGEAALAAFPDDARAIQAAADARYHRFAAADSEAKADKTDLVEARRLFERQLALEPDSPTANGHLVSIMLWLGTPPDQTTVDAARFMSRYYRAPIVTGTHLDAADVFARAGLVQDACRSLRHVAGWVARSDDALDEEKRAELTSRGYETPKERADRIAESLGDQCVAS